MNQPATALFLCLCACAANSPGVGSPAAADRPIGEWRTTVARTGASLRGISVVDTDTVWVTGSQGTVARSVDGGGSWQQVPPGDCADCDFRDVHAFDRDNAVVMVAGQPARVYRTVDGGASWRVVHHDPRPAAFFDALAFDGDSGYLLGDPQDGAFTLLRSDDRGASWRALPGPAAAAGEAAFAASGTCLATAHGVLHIVTGGSVCRLLTSHDGGQTFDAVALPLRHGAASQGAFSIGMNGAAGIVVGGDYAAPLATQATAARTDTGAAWLPVGGEGVLGYRSAVAWIDAAHVLAVGERLASCSADGGRTWQPFGSEGFHALGKGRDGALFACGSRGRVARLVRRQ